MEKNPALLLASVVFAIIALFHIIRALFKWDAIISGFSIPVYLSYLAALILGFLAWQMYDASRR